MSESWYPNASRRPGPAGKFGYTDLGNYADKIGEIRHSMVGPYVNAMGVLDNLSRPSSWTFSIRKDGIIVQHYPLTANTWHGNDTDMDDDVRANVDLVGVEYEGGPIGNTTEALTPMQYTSGNELSTWMAAQFGFHRFSRHLEADHWWLVEHREVGNTPTACPSGRIPWDRVLTDLNTKETYILSVTWATWKDRPVDVPYRSYLLMVTSNGLIKRWVPNYEEHLALAESGVAGDMPIPVSLRTLLAFKGTPEATQK